MKQDITTDVLSNAKLAYMKQDNFFADIVGNLAGALENTVGLRDAEGFITEVGTLIGEGVSDLYKTGKPSTTQDIARILVDLKDRIGGEFKVESVTDEQIILTNTRCPFAHRVEGRPSLCMMTTNVFGRVVADRNGYAHVLVDDSIAHNGKGCHVTVTLSSELAPDAQGFEFFGD